MLRLGGQALESPPSPLPSAPVLHADVAHLGLRTKSRPCDHQSLFHVEGDRSHCIARWPIAGSCTTLLADRPPTVAVMLPADSQSPTNSVSCQRPVALTPTTAGIANEKTLWLVHTPPWMREAILTPACAVGWPPFRVYNIIQYEESLVSSQHCTYSSRSWFLNHVFERLPLR